MVVINDNISNFDCKIKISFLGYSGTGKTSIINKYLYDEFKYNVQATIGFIFQYKCIDIDSKKIQIVISDTAGQEKYNAIPKMYYRNINAFVIVYDVTDSDSFERINFWLEDIKLNGNKNSFIFIVGNKTDVSDYRTISYEKANSFVEKMNNDDPINNQKIPYAEVSAKNGNNVQEFMNRLINTCYTNNNYEIIPNKIIDTADKNGSKKCC